MIRLTLRARPPTRLSLRGFIPERLAGSSEIAIAREALRQGNRQGVLGDWFRVEVSGGAEDRLVIAGADDRLDDIGAGMTRGELVIEGNAGARAGVGMSGGRILIEGSTGMGAGTAMSGGELRIAGDAGDHLGTALPGERHGMREGIVIVEGSAGAGVGDRLRRGLIVVRGPVGPFCGARMAAGTIVVGGEMGASAGAAMRRGTLVAAGKSMGTLPGFADCGVHELTVQRLLARVLAKHGFGELADRLRALRRWQGDLAVGGRGEILTAP
jgi:formylmethanofuran dehydrogenase subunit C